MRILRVIPSMNPSLGGPCQGIRNSIPYMQLLGVENEVVCMDKPNAPYLGKDKFPIHAIGQSVSPWAYSKNLAPWLEKNLHRFDAVIVHGLWLYHGFAVKKAVSQLKKTLKTALPKVYVMPHGMLDPYFQKAPGRKLKAIRNWFYWKLVERHIINSADGLLFTCEEELQLARETFTPYSPKQELNIGYGVIPPPPHSENMDKAFTSKVALKRPDSYLLFLSRIHDKKGIDLLVKAYIRLKQEQQSIPKLVIAGPGLNSSYGQKMQQLAAAEHDIIFSDMLSGDAKWGAFYGCEAFILPSHQENFGIAVVEALACGKPVLISNQVNIWREIEQEGSGIIAEDTTDKTHDMLLQWLQLSEQDKQQMQKKASFTYTKHFSPGPAINKLLAAVN